MTQVIAQEKWLKEVTEAPGKTLQRLLGTWSRATPEDQIYLLEAILRQYGRTQSHSPQLYEILKSVVQDPPKLFEQDNPVMVLEAYLSNPSVNTDEAKATLVSLENYKGENWEDLISLVNRGLLPPVEFSVHHRIERILDTDSEGVVASGFVTQTREISDTPSIWSLPVEALLQKFRTEVWSGITQDYAWFSPGRELFSNRVTDETLLSKYSDDLRNYRNLLSFNYVDEIPDDGWTEDAWNRYVNDVGKWLVTLNLRDPSGTLGRFDDPYLKAVLSWAQEERVI